MKKNLDFLKIEKDLTQITTSIIDTAKLITDQIFVLGCSTSEIIGGVIGENSSQDTGKLIIDTLINILEPKGIYLAVQGCEHVNRSLCVPIKLLEKHSFEQVSVIPQPHAGGAACAYYYTYLAETKQNPVMIEHITALAGIDIGNTHIGMHIKFVQVPFKHAVRNIGYANVSGLTSRPKLIGGERASYSFP